MYAYNPCCTYKVRICCTQTSMLNAYNQYAVTIQCVCRTHTVVCCTHTVRNTHIVHLYYAYSTHTVRMLYAYIFIYYASCNRLFFYRYSYVTVLLGGMVDQGQQPVIGSDLYPPTNPLPTSLTLPLSLSLSLLEIAFLSLKVHM